VAGGAGHRLPALPLTVTDHVRVCKDCGEEYRPEIVRCADCGGELEDVFPGMQRKPAQAPEPSPAAELEGFRELYRTTRATDLVPVVERLREADIPSRLAELREAVEGAPPRFAVLVPEAESGRALAAISALVAPHEDAADVHAVETRFDPERGYLQCPACGAEPPPDASECPECGLGLGLEGSADEEKG
jgi:hypothetical protein